MEMDRMIPPDTYTCFIKEDDREGASILSGVNDIESGLASMGFSVKTGVNGDLMIGTYYGRLSDELNDYLNRLAPFIEPGGYIEWDLIKDEETQHWRWCFDGLTLTINYLDADDEALPLRGFN